jgi:hypothetical protein
LGPSPLKRRLQGEVPGVEKDELDVTCYSGHIYAQRPVSLRWRGQCYRVREIEREWREPGERYFLVQTECSKRLKLCYNEALGQWSVTELPRR